MALKDSSSDFAPRKRDKVVDTHRLQCFRKRGGISDVILSSSWFALFIAEMIEVQEVFERVLCVVVNSLDVQHFLHHGLPLALMFSFPQRVQHLKSRSDDVACIAFDFSNMSARKVRRWVFRSSRNVDLAYARPPKFLHPVTGHMCLSLYAMGRLRPDWHGWSATFLFLVSAFRQCAIGRFLFFFVVGLGKNFLLGVGD